MTYPISAPKLRLRTPADIIAAVPYLLGFHPSDSIVALAMRGTKVVFHVRIDLLPTGASPEETAHLAQHLADIFDTQGATGVLAIGYGDPPRVTALQLATAEAMRERGLEVIELLRVAEGRYWSYQCQDPSCCPPEGVPYDISTSTVAAQATFAGCTALPDREALVEMLAPPTGDALASTEAATSRAEQRLHTTRQRCEGAEGHEGSDAPRRDTGGGHGTVIGREALGSAIDRYSAGGRLTDDELAWLAVLLRDDIRLRDAAWDRIDSDYTPPTVHAALWLDVVQRCVPRVVVAPAVLLGYCWWRLGDGTRAGMAIDRALAVEPECSAALLIAQLLWRGVPPSIADALVRRRPSKKAQRRSRRRRRSAR
jgi:hypothetical protein